MSGLGGEAVQAGATQAAAEAAAQLGAMYASFGDALTLGWRAAKTKKSILMPLDPKITAANLRGGQVMPDGSLKPAALPFGEKIPASEELIRAIDLVGQIGCGCHLVGCWGWMSSERFWRCGVKLPPTE